MMAHFNENDMKINMTFKSSQDNILTSIIRHYQGPDIVELIHFLVNSGIDASYVNPTDESTALMLWLRHSHKLQLDAKEALDVALLLANSSQVSFVNRDGSSALWELCKSPNTALKNSLELFKTLMEQGAEDYVHPKENCTVLMLWLRENSDLDFDHVIQVATELADKSSVLNFTSQDGSSALWELCRASKLDVEKSLSLFDILLQSKDADIDQINELFNEVGTPYFYLLNRFLPLQQTSGLEELTDLFISNNLKLDATDKYNDNALTLIAKLYVDKEWHDSSGIVSIAHCLIKAGIDVNHNSLEGNALNAMFFSLSKDYTNRMPFIELLINSGIDINHTDNYFHFTPLSTVINYADMTKESTLDLMELLVSKGAVHSSDVLISMLQSLADRVDHKLNELYPAFEQLLIVNEKTGEYREVHLGQFPFNNPLLFYLQRRLVGDRPQNFEAVEEKSLYDLIDLFAKCHRRREAPFDDANWHTVVLQVICRLYHGANVFDICNLLRNHGADVKAAQSFGSWTRHADKKALQQPIETVKDSVKSVTLTKMRHLLLTKRFASDNELGPSFVTGKAIVKTLRESDATTRDANKRLAVGHEVKSAAKKAKPAENFTEN